MNESRQDGEFLRVGLIGCGKMSKNHVTAISLVSGASIVAAADPAIANGVLPDWFGEDVEKFGYTPKCPGCKALLQKKPPQSHSEACRFRI